MGSAREEEGPTSPASASLAPLCRHAGQGREGEGAPTSRRSGGGRGSAGRSLPRARLAQPTAPRRGLVWPHGLICIRGERDCNFASPSLLECNLPPKFALSEHRGCRGKNVFAYLC